MKIKGILLKSGKTTNNNFYSKKVLKEVVKNTKEIPICDGYNVEGKPRKMIGAGKVKFEDRSLNFEGEILDKKYIDKIKKGDSIGPTFTVDKIKEKDGIKEIGIVKLIEINYCSMQKMSQDEMKITEVEKDE